jgi:hypothetical protein
MQDDLGHTEVNDEAGDVDQSGNKRGSGTGGINAAAQQDKRQHRTGITFTPSLTFNQDVTGFSADYAIVGGQITGGVNLRIDLRQKFFTVLGATITQRGATRDANRDRTGYTWVFGINLM